MASSLALYWFQRVLPLCAPDIAPVLVQACSCANSRGKKPHHVGDLIRQGRYQRRASRARRPTSQPRVHRTDLIRQGRYQRRASRACGPTSQPRVHRTIDTSLQVCSTHPSHQHALSLAQLGCVCRPAASMTVRRALGSFIFHKIHSLL
jgi:hypothetical protein